jgi:Flp pilus assembly protein TadD
MSRRRIEARKQKLAERASGSSTHAPSSAPSDPIETLIARSRRERARGDTRRAVVLLRQACALDEWRARTWTLLGATLARTGAHDEARRALNQARWLRARAGEKARAAVTARFADDLPADAA